VGRLLLLRESLNLAADGLISGTDVPWLSERRISSPRLIDPDRPIHGSERGYGCTQYATSRTLTPSQHKCWIGDTLSHKLILQP
jgi:hypothetical protein